MYTNVTPYKNYILFRGIDEKGKRIKKRIEFRPKLWIPSKKENAKYRSINNLPLEELTFPSIYDWKEYVQEAQKKDLPIFGVIRPQYQFIAENYPGELHPDFNKIRIAYFDIETALCEDGSFPTADQGNAKIISITIKYSNFDKFIVFGLKPYVNHHPDKQIYVECASETELLMKFLDLWKNNYPDVISGWYSTGYDLPFLYNRICRLISEDEANQLSPWKVVIKENVLDPNFKEREILKIFGISQLDYLDVYKKFTYTTLERYTLDFVAEHELGKNKVEYSHIGTLHELYEKDHQLFIDYNIKDVALVIELEEKLKLLELVITLAYDSKVNYEDCFYQVRMWDSIIFNHLLKKNIIIPNKRENVQDREIQGAYVKNPQIGYKYWIVSFDVTSLYPHLIMNYNISPDTKVNSFKQVTINDLLEKRVDMTDIIKANHCLAANGQPFTRSRKGFLPELMEMMFAQRREYKKKMIEAEKKYQDTKNPNLIKEISKYKNLQQVKKICLNSAYGAMGNKYFRFFDVRLAEAVTLSGQLTIRWIENKLNQFLNKEFGTKDQDYCLASDTDSVYLNFEPFVKKLETTNQDEICQKINEFIQKKLNKYIANSFAELSQYMNCETNKIEMKQEVIANNGFFIAKKRYCLNVLESEGVKYNPPKLKIMGVEAIKSSTPTFCRKTLKEAIRIILQEGEESLQRYIQRVRKEFQEQDIEDIAFPRTANNISNFISFDGGLYKKATPIHIRGCILYNNYIREHGLKLPEIRDGEKIKYIYLTVPNLLKKENIISFPGKLPKEFDEIRNYVDYNTQFEKSFISPLKDMLEAINWSTKKRRTLEDE